MTSVERTKQLLDELFPQMKNDLIKDDLWYKLDENKNIVKSSVYYRDETDRRVGQSIVNDARISTVFLGMDHGWNGVPMLFETMVFGGEHDQYQRRYSTWNEAVRGHKETEELVLGLRKE